MIMDLRALLRALLCLLLVLQACHAYKYNTYFFKQRVDHFSFANQDTFIQRYLLSSEYFDHNNGPIFFYAGNEGDITVFAENTGFMWEIAPEFKALLVFAEHRYYGISEPYGNRSLTTPNYSGYLTSEQALADYVDLISYLRYVIKGAMESPVIVFGGSYGGMLAAWLRMKYPHIVQGAIAASAPILQFTDMTPCDRFGQVVTADFAKASENCVEVIRKSWAAINDVTTTEEGMTWLSKTWKLCQPLQNKEDVKILKDYLTNVWIILAMLDYPYPVDFVVPLPAYPVKVVCSKLTNPNLDGKELLQELFGGLTVYFNYTGGSKCLSYDWHADGSLDNRGWDFQACTEMVMPSCYDGVKDFFEPTPWDFQEYSENCYKTWGVAPRSYMAPLMYGGWDYLNCTQAHSNIIFSNGLLDPWSAGGVLWNVTDSVVAVIIPEGAHHLDLRGANPADPPSALEARRIEKEHIARWIGRGGQSEDSNQITAP